MNEDRCLLNSLTRACRLTKDVVSIWRPIHKEMLSMILKTIDYNFSNAGQMYLKHLYLALISTTYYGLFRVGEVTLSPHAVRACDIHIGCNKNKLLFVLRTFKTHNCNSQPQTIKILSKATLNKETNEYCPFTLLRNYIAKRQPYLSDNEIFFVFHDRTPV